MNVARPRTGERETRAGDVDGRTRPPRPRVSLEVRGERGEDARAYDGEKRADTVDPPACVGEKRAVTACTRVDTREKALSLAHELVHLR